MRELTLEEMEQVGGGITIIGDPGKIFLTKLVMKGLEYVANNANDYYEYLKHCWATYGAGPYDYRVAS